MFVFFFISCLFRFISIIPDTALSDIITIISLLCLPGNWEASRGLQQSGRAAGPGPPARHSPGTTHPGAGDPGEGRGRKAQDPARGVKSQKGTTRTSSVREEDTKGGGKEPPAGWVSILPTISLGGRENSREGQRAHRKT